MFWQASSSTETIRRNGWRLSLFFSLWTLLGLLDATHTFLRSLYEGSPFPWARALALGLALWYAWALVGVFVLALVRRFPLERRVWAKRLVLYLASGIGFVLLKLLMDYPIIKLFYCPDPEHLTLAA